MQVKLAWEVKPFFVNLKFSPVNSCHLSNFTYDLGKDKGSIFFEKKRSVSISAGTLMKGKLFFRPFLKSCAMCLSLESDWIAPSTCWMSHHSYFWMVSHNFCHKILYLHLTCGTFPGSVTRNYFENLVRALETGLKDVGSTNNQATCSKTSSSKSLGGKSKSGKIKAAGTSSRSGGPSHSFDESNLWSCDHCTYANPRSTNTCQMCEHHR